jgi:hypothetical protein
MCTVLLPPGYRGTFWLPWLRLFHAFSSVVRQIPGYKLQRRGTARTSQIIFFLLLCVFRSLYSWYCLCVNVYCAAAIGHILFRNCLLWQVIEGKKKGGIEVTGRKGRRRRKLLDDLKERCGYFHLKEEVLDRTMWTAWFGRGFGPVVRQTTKWMHEVLPLGVKPTAVKNK